MPSCIYVEILLNICTNYGKDSDGVTDCHGRQACFTVIPLPQINEKESKRHRTHCEIMYDSKIGRK